MYSPHCQCGGRHWWCGNCGAEVCHNTDGVFCWWCGDEKPDSRAGRMIRQTKRRNAIRKAHERERVE